MDDDVDMDAPQISTLPQAEATPPPSRPGSKLRVKLLVSDKKGKGKSSPPSAPAAARKSAPPNQTQPQPQSEEEVDEEDEEDQLIDDDEPAPSISAQVATGTKRKAPPKKPSRPRKSDKLDKDDSKKLDEPREPPDTDGQTVTTTPAALPEKPSPKKKPAPRKTAPATKSKIKVPPKGTKALAVPPVEDAAMSETHTITAPSSPLPIPVSRGASPEPEEVEPPPPPVPEQPEESAPLPVPVYPLPSKPFPVQPPPKIGTGFAPVQTLDRGGAKVRQWRIANREIRGIAGGRWFARTWVGDKESEFATTLASASAVATTKLADSDRIAIPKAITSISAPAGKGSKSKGARGSAAISTAPSRSGSIVPELHTPKAPTKMRNIITGPSPDAGDEPEVVVPEPRGISTVS